MKQVTSSRWIMRRFKASFQASLAHYVLGLSIVLLINMSFGSLQRLFRESRFNGFTWSLADPRTYFFGTIVVMAVQMSFLGILAGLSLMRKLPRFVDLEYATIAILTGFVALLPGANTLRWTELYEKDPTEIY